MNKSKFYITTAIAYVNAPPHVGFALELCQADVIARYRRLLGDDVYYLTGTDEHGQKIVKAAQEADKDPQVFADEVSQRFRDLAKDLNISNDSFIRTSDKKVHWPGAQEMWQNLNAAEVLYKKYYEGLYCSGCEAFKVPSDLVNGLCSDHNRKPEIIKEENYFFKLSDFQEKLANIYEQGIIKIIPEHRRTEVLNFINQGLEDVSFSRPSKDLKWGIPVPGDKKHTIYVWADALVNYISALGFGRSEDELFKKFWPADAHVIGKDIMRFHAIIWPAMLMVVKLPLPKTILVHGHIQSGGQKMSKSLGNVIDPFGLIAKYGADAVRYFLLKEIPAMEDGDMTPERMADVYSAELANGLGNLVARVCALAEKSPKPLKMSSADFEISVNDAWDFYGSAMARFRFSEALSRIYELAREGNLYIDREKPWQGDNWQKAIPNLLYLIVNMGWMLEPFLPQTAEKIFKQIGLDKSAQGSWEEQGLKPHKGEPLFPRI